MNVNGSYARDSILPKKFGVEANPKNLNDLKFKKANNDRIAIEQLAVAKELGAKLDDSSVTLTIKAGEGGRAFSSMFSKEIVEAIEDQLGIDIDKRKVMLSDPIRSIGSFGVSVKLHKNMTTRLAVKVVGA